MFLFKITTHLYGILLLIFFTFCQLCLSAQNQESLVEMFLKNTRVKKGLCVYVGDHHQRLLALHEKGGFLVHGLISKQSSLLESRNYLQSRGVYGQVSVELSNWRDLPYQNNLINFMVLDNYPRALKAGLSLKEIKRILTPRGEAIIGAGLKSSQTLTEVDLKRELQKAGIKNYKILKENGLWALFKKERPEDMDEWTHSRHTPDGNAVSQDSMGLPTGTKWVAGPIWPMGSRKNNTWNFISANGRNFYYTYIPIEKADIGIHNAQLQLIARDSFNGLFLWQRTITPRVIKDYFKYNSMSIVAKEDQIFGLVGDKKVVSMDASTGKILKTFPGASMPRQVYIHKDSLIVRADKKVLSFNFKTGTKNWEVSAYSEDLVLGEQKIFFLNRVNLVCLDFSTGKELWRIDTAPLYKGKMILKLCFDDKVAIQGWSTPTTLYAISAKDGKITWKHEYHYGGKVKEVFFINGLVWTPMIFKKGEGGKSRAWVGLDAKNGEIKKTIEGSVGSDCSHITATKKYLYSTRFMEFLELESGKKKNQGWTRGPCGVNGVFANNLLYTSLYACACNPSALRGVVALNHESRGYTTNDFKTPLIKGPDFGKIQNSKTEDKTGNWPIYRHDGRRSGFIDAPINPSLQVLWKKQVARQTSESFVKMIITKPNFRETISAPVISDNIVYVAVPNEHRIQALKAESGELLWNVYANARIDSPPTIYKGLCIFGSRDGFVYCVNAKTGTLVWRFCTAPRIEKMMVFEQLESLWPVNGSVLIFNDMVFFVAGRSSKGFFVSGRSSKDRNIFLYALDPFTGKMYFRNTPKRMKRGFYGISDILVCDQANIYLRNLKIDPQTGENKTLYVKYAKYKINHKHLISGQQGFLDASWRIFGQATHRNLQKWHLGYMEGELLVFNKNVKFSFNASFGHPGHIRIKPTLIAKSKKTEPAKLTMIRIRKSKKIELGKNLWQIQLKKSEQIWALLLSQQTLFAAGIKDRPINQAGTLWSFSVKDGSKQNEIKLPSTPLYDGMAAANGRLYISTTDGQILCLGKKSR